MLISETVALFLTTLFLIFLKSNFGLTFMVMSEKIGKRILGIKE